MNDHQPTNSPLYAQRLSAKLIVNKRIIAAVTLNQGKQSNQFVGRLWTAPLKESPGDTFRVEIYDGARIITELTLHPGTNPKGFPVLTASEDTGDLYCWGTVTNGYNDTKGFTAGIMFRRRKKATAPQPRQEARA